ncbi:amino acid ABC transporter permease [Enemella evansiae]|uniref:amino acid ABC transporter permease n=1 Tax=Enemella evansiae TaxID=2016499 RepID=UPI00105F8793|nr:amino acid ABC transporter permease [Enemella evansiae]TDO85316.1 amino acid ABC transporter membrane protein (PAAT family) [Enemella evansiae]
MAEQIDAPAAEAWPPRVPDRLVEPRHPGRWVGGVLLVAVVLALVWSVATNPKLHWQSVGEFLFSPTILGGLVTTVVLACLSMLIGIGIGLLMALLRSSANPVARVFAGGYIWLVRGTPLLVQVLVWGNLALFAERIFIGIPGTDLYLLDYSTNNLITPFVASVLALSINEGAYMAEVFRGGLLAIDRGQHEAVAALGLSRLQGLRKVILPQVVRVITPPTGNQFINMLKMTSLVSVIAGGDLLTQAQNISAGNLRTFELLIVASIWYLAVTSIATIGQYLLERRMDHSTRRPRTVAVANEPAGEPA